ncbi:hypothetical protein DXC28_13155 [Ruminococcus sp. OM08-9BH]|jgi:hypothetical protein|nr:hypothetical protein DXC28_13155 [Ruminococcus sp. OM08-9BH]
MKMGFSQWKIREILGKRMWIMWGNYCGLGWKIVYNWEIGFHKLTRCGKYGEFMCIKLSTVKIPQIKGFFEDAIKNHPEKVDSFTGNPLVIHKLSTFCG